MRRLVAMSSVRATAGAVPVVNERGAVSMVKVKVSRHRAGVGPNQTGSSDSEEDDPALAASPDVEEDAPQVLFHSLGPREEE